MDSEVGLPSYPDNYFDLAIVDPPYGIGETWSKSRTDRFYKRGSLHSYDNRSAPGKEFFEQLIRVSKNQIIWGGNYFTEHLPATNAWIAWDKMKTQGIMSDFELAWTSFSKVATFARFLWDGARKCERVDKIHPHQKPRKLYRWILDQYASHGDTILDTHVGSASSLIEFELAGFDYVGYEKDRDYFKLAKKRMDQVLAQTRMAL
jgi:site-specific DNA-methyltransferase (adenine-specific)